MTQVLPRETSEHRPSWRQQSRYRSSLELLPLLRQNQRKDHQKAILVLKIRRTQRRVRSKAPMMLDIWCARGCFVEPPRLPGHRGLAIGPMILVASGISFLAIQKITKKTTHQKTALFRHFGDFQDFPISIFSNLGSILGPSWPLFWMFLLGTVLLSIFKILKEKHD